MHELNTIHHNLQSFELAVGALILLQDILKHTYYIYFLVYAPVRLWKVTQYVMANDRIHAI